MKMIGEGGARPEVEGEPAGGEGDRVALHERLGGVAASEAEAAREGEAVRGECGDAARAEEGRRQAAPEAPVARGADHRQAEQAHHRAQRLGDAASSIHRCQQSRKTCLKLMIATTNKNNCCLIVLFSLLFFSS